MSTKATIRHGERWHLYQECLEDDAVYLELETIEVKLYANGSNTNVLIRLDNALAIETGIISEEEKPSEINWDNFGKNLDRFLKK